MEAVCGRLLRVATTLAPEEVRPPAPGLRSTTTRPRRGGAAAERRPTRAYQLCLLRWVRGEPSEALVARMRQAASRRDADSRLIPVGGRAQALLVREDQSGGPSRERLRAAVDSVVEAVHAVQPDAEIHAFVGDRIRSLDQLRVATARLRLLARYARPQGGDHDLVRGQRASLACLLETLDRRRAAAFVEGQLATLRAYDSEHGTNLQHVLELALDHENRNAAARAAFMHRNTFRRQLGKALALIDVDLASPEERLALHVALKLRRLDSVLRLDERLRRVPSDTWRAPPGSS